MEEGPIPSRYFRGELYIWSNEDGLFHSHPPFRGF